MAMMTYINVHHRWFLILLRTQFSKRNKIACPFSLRLNFVRVLLLRSRLLLSDFDYWIHLLPNVCSFLGNQAIAKNFVRQCLVMLVTFKLEMHCTNASDLLGSNSSTMAYIYWANRCSFKEKQRTGQSMND